MTRWSDHSMSPGARALPGARGRARVPGRRGGDAGSRLGDRGHRGRVPGGHREPRRRVRRERAVRTRSWPRPARRSRTWSAAPPRAWSSARAPPRSPTGSRTRCRGRGRRATTSWCPGSTTTPTCGRGSRRPAGSGSLVQWAEVDLVTGELPAEQYADLIGPRTRAGRGHRGEQRDRHPAGRGGDRRARARGRARCATWTACTPPRTCRWTWPRSAPTSTRPAPTSGRGRTWPRVVAGPDAARDGLAGQARPVLERGAVAVRARHAAVRRPGRGDRGGGPPGRARARARADRPGGGRDAPGAGPRVDGGGRGLRGGAVRPAARRPGASSTA